MAKRRPNPLKGPKIPVTGKQSKNNTEALNGILEAAAAFFEALLGPPKPQPLPGARLFRCSRCGFQIQTIGHSVEPRVGPMGCGQTFEEQQPGRAFPSKPRVVAMTKQEAAIFILRHCGASDSIRDQSDVIDRPQVRKMLYRRAAAKLHTDNKETGNHDLFVKLQEAMEVLNET
jgi:hypothetical protein